MKTNQLIINLVTFLLLAGSTAMAQRIVEKTLPYQPGQRVFFDLPFGDSIQITGWDKNEVALVAKVSINNNRLNDAFTLAVKEHADALTFKTGFDEEKLKLGKKEDCPSNGNHYSYSDNNQYYTCADIYFELKVPRKAAIELSSISANVEAKGLAGPNHIKTISGFIDFSWPQQQDAELNLKSITGELYTNLTFDILNRQDTPPMVGYTLKGRNGKGGTLVDLETISSDIFLRAQ